MLKQEKQQIYNCFALRWIFFEGDIRVRSMRMYEIKFRFGKSKSFVQIQRCCAQWNSEDKMIKYYKILYKREKGGCARCFNRSLFSWLRSGRLNPLCNVALCIDTINFWTARKASETLRGESCCNTLLEVNSRSISCLIFLRHRLYYADIIYLTKI